MPTDIADDRRGQNPFVPRGRQRRTQRAYEQDLNPKNMPSRIERATAEFFNLDDRGTE